MPADTQWRPKSNKSKMLGLNKADKPALAVAKIWETFVNSGSEIISNPLYLVLFFYVL